jgi:glycosyltransferase involved in cell wall biosynthesis
MTADAVGGVWSYALDLADALAERDVAVTLAVMGARLSADQRAQLRRSRVARCFASDFALEWQQDWSSFRRSAEWLREVAEAARPDVIHVNGYAHAALGWRQPVLVVAHSDVLSWFEAVRGQPAPPGWDRYRVEVASGLASADLVVAPTRAMLAALQRHHRVDTATRVIPNGVSAGPSPQPKRPYVLAAGRMWDEAKNVAALHRVAGRVPVEVAAWTGRDELRQRMAEAAVFCAPARYEPFGLGPLEAALAGCTLVLGDIPSLREVWGDAAYYADPDDDDALVAALQRALREPRDARPRAARYTPARMAAAYADAYRRLSVEALVA